MTRANADPLAVEDLRNVVRVDASDVERDDADPVFGGLGAKDRHARDGQQLRQRVRDERTLVLVDLVHADGLQVVDGRPEPDRVDVRRRAGLELPGQLVPGRKIDRDAGDHVAAVQERPHLLQDRGAAPHDTGAGRGEHLVAAECQEIAVEIADVDRGVRDRLGPVDDDERASRARLGDERLRRGDRPKAVARVGDGDELRALRHGRGELVAPQPAVVVDVHDHEGRADLLGELLPGHEVRVVLEHRRDDHVAGADVLAPPGVHDQIQALGGIAAEDDLAGLRRVDELGDLLAGALEERRCPLAELIDAPMDVGVVLQVDGRHRVDDLPRLLARRRVVEVDERLAVHGARQDREVRADALDVQRGRSLLGCGDRH